MLVVDDNRDSAGSLARCCGCWGTRSRRPTTGSRRWRRRRLSGRSVVLLDIGLPGMDGYAAARQIRSGPGGDEVTLVALTGWGQEEDRRMAARRASTTT